MEQTVLQRPEILAPAGNADMLRAAVFAGADAVYLGLDGYNARRSAGNFDPDALREAVCFCHARGVAVHVTLNTLVYAAELGGLADAVRAVAAAGADAVIVDDLATAQLVRSIAPGLRLHGSTQMSIHTAEGAKMLAKLGYSRAILARELSLTEIEAVVKAKPDRMRSVCTRRDVHVHERPVHDERVPGRAQRQPRRLRGSLPPAV